MGSYPRAPDRLSLGESLFLLPSRRKALAETLPYVELNPVTADLVEGPCEWAWSSALARMNGADRYEPLHQSAFRDSHIGENWKRILEFGWTDDASQRRIRTATRTGRPLGNSPAKRGTKPKLRPEVTLRSFAFS